MKKLSIVLIVSSLLWACTQNTEVEIHKKDNTNNILTMSILYHQYSSEYKALMYQSYNLAKQRIAEAVKSKAEGENLAVVLDIDETVLDNSPCMAKQVLNNASYPVYWKEWCELAIAEPIPGVVSFLQYADSLGVNIFYVSNRKDELLVATEKNLRKWNLPQANINNIMLRTNTKSKEPRRKIIESQGYTIALLIGDNLGDFTHDFQLSKCSDRDKLVAEQQNLFGEKWIILPNSIYGKWTKNLGLYKENINLDSLIKARFKSF